jgi:uncharacterized UBP type Zn finger protein
VPVDPSKLRALVEMGFPSERSTNVLRHFKNDQELAMEYLINTPQELDSQLLQNGQSNVSFLYLNNP